MFQQQQSCKLQPGSYLLSIFGKYVKTNTRHTNSITAETKENKTKVESVKLEKTFDF